LIFLATFVTYLITNMNTRLKQFLAAENITQSQFADKIEVVRASVSHVLSGRNNPSYEFIKAIMAKYPTLNMEWLMFGKGRMYKNQLSDLNSAPTSLPVETVKENTSDSLLFNDFDSYEHEDYVSSEPEVRNQEGNISPTVPTVSIDTLKSLINPAQSTVKQRNVSKIIVLFDDGSFQEL